MILHSDLVGIEDDNPLPASFSLSQNYPNPFNARTSIRYSLANAGAVKLSVYDILGNCISALFDGVQEAGEHGVVWDAGDVASGVYFARLETAGQAKSIRMVLLK